MNQLERMSLILDLVSEGHETLTRLGHTHVQKLVYLLEEAKGVKFGYDFRMHYYGPYSEQLWGTLTTMRHIGLINIKLHTSGYGYDISESEGSRRAEFQELCSELGVDEEIGQYRDSWQGLLQLFSQRPGTRSLELLGTTHFVHKMLALYDEQPLDDQVIKGVNALKPHFSHEEIKEALQTLNDEGLLGDS